ncbi:MAG TPA: hypothetical protein VGT41_01025 [Candidatus Babeliales bacterium]|nr:hypothetical protein [Candidatus Babeliales bacterium]
MKKSLIILAMTAATIHGITTAEPTKIILESEALKFGDGKSFGITGNHIGFTLQVARKLDQLLFGSKNKSGHYTGIFTFRGEPHSIRTLALLEKELLALPNLDQATKNDLANMLIEIKNTFNETVLPFIKHTHGIRPMILTLIEESCQKRNRMDSFLFTWGKCREGAEAETINKSFHSVVELDRFVTDLIGFLTDFANSCPKAYKQFVDMVNNKQK